MKLTLISAVLPLSLLSLTGLASAVHAQLNATFNTPQTIYVSGLPQTVAVTATLTNDYAVPVYLNSDFSSADTPLLLDDNPFQSTFVSPLDAQGNPLPQPFLAAKGGRYTGPMFDLFVPAGTAAGNYSVFFDLQGGTDTSGMTDLATTPANFHLDVLPVPEASTTVSFGLLLVLGSAAWIVRRRKAPTA